MPDSNIYAFIFPYRGSKSHYMGEVNCAWLVYSWNMFMILVSASYESHYFPISNFSH